MLRIKHVSDPLVDLKAYLVQKADIVNGALERLLPRDSKFPVELHKAMHYSVFAGGKRLRPVLVLAACEAIGSNSAPAMNTACAMECIHTYSLIHDDLPAIDNDDLRRGRPTCHKVFGEACAILAGDALLTLAFELVSVTRGASAEALMRVIHEVARAAGASGMVGGQIVDIASEKKNIEFPILEYIHVHKTGALIVASVRSGAILGNVCDKDLASLTRYAEAAGLAFQIADDILDVEGETSAMGKASGADESRGKATYPSILGMKEAKKRAKELSEAAIAEISYLGPKAEPLIELARYFVARKS